MANDIAEMRELMECYRRRSRTVPFKPIAAAYAEAADHLDELIADRDSASLPKRPPVEVH